MKFSELLDIINDLPFFETGLLLSGCVDPNDVRKQLSRWEKAGRIYQLRRGLYTLAPPYLHKIPHPFEIANALERGSYVSCQSALAFYGLIPEGVEKTISVFSGKPINRGTPVGEFIFFHITTRFMYGYQLVSLPHNAKAFVALPEKALLDLIHLQPGGDDPLFIQELRLQHLEKLDIKILQALVEKYNSPKLTRAARVISMIAEKENQDFERVSI